MSCLGYARLSKRRAVRLGWRSAGTIIRGRQRPMRGVTWARAARAGRRRLQAPRCPPPPTSQHELPTPHHYLSYPLLSVTPSIPPDADRDALRKARKERMRAERAQAAERAEREAATQRALAGVRGIEARLEVMAQLEAVEEAQVTGR